MRLFIAIPLPSDIAQRAFAVLPPTLPGLRRVQPDNLHVTLAFLGETPESRLPDVAAAAEDAARAVRRFTLVFDRTGRFPERGRPRVLWLGFADGLPSVERLGEGVSRALRENALEFEDGPLSPHLTLARVRDEATAEEARTVAATIEKLEVPNLSVDVREIAVVQSVLSSKGPRYTARARAPLGGVGKEPG
ncbi:MAG: 2'-5' RNA ligase [Chloroflexi bacterium 13_1_40CM_68_21]|nr:MAG: 2'-5' RNA ligase [Chloroflexi bacterium 13_1_40CM_68_21]